LAAMIAAGRGEAQPSAPPDTSAPEASRRPAGEPPPADASTLVEMTVGDVVPIEVPTLHAVVLISLDGERLLPLFIDEESAVAIAFRLAKRAPPFPVTVDLLDDVVTKMGGNVTEVRIDEVKDETLNGHILVQQGGRKHLLPARPSDSIALALSSEARIRVTRGVLDEAGIRRDELKALMEQAEPGVGGSGPVSPDIEL
jgi:bifunctional DNase/RNase